MVVWYCGGGVVVWCCGGFVVKLGCCGWLYEAQKQQNGIQISKQTSTNTQQSHKNHHEAATAAYQNGAFVGSDDVRAADEELLGGLPGVVGVVQLHVFF